MKSNATCEILQFYSTWQTTISLTEQITGFYSIHFSQLWYWDNITRIFLHRTPKSARKRLTSLNEASKDNVNNNIKKASNTSLKGNADSKQRLIISHHFFKVYKAKWIKKNSQNTNKTSFGSKTRVPSQRVQIKSSSENGRTFSTILTKSYA